MRTSGGSSGRYFESDKLPEREILRMPVSWNQKLLGPLACLTQFESSRDG